MALAGFDRRSLSVDCQLHAMAASSLAG